MTNNKQQTPVQRFASLLSVTDRAKYNGIIEEALEEEKNHIIDAILDNRNITSQVTYKDAEEWYNNRFGGGQQ
jgi:hypothetical protein